MQARAFPHTKSTDYDSFFINYIITLALSAKYHLDIGKASADEGEQYQPMCISVDCRSTWRLKPYRSTLRLDRHIGRHSVDTRPTID